MIRDLIIEEAMTWLRTPWQHAQACKHAGVDCGRLLIEVYANVGLIERFTPDYYPQDFALHCNEERFLQNIERYATEVLTPEKGDIAMWKWGRCYSHAAIVIDYPVIIHAKMDNGVLLDDATQAELKNRPVKFYTVLKS